MEQYKYDSGDDRYHVDLSGQIRLEMAGRVDCPAGWSGKVHCHPFWEFIHIRAGSGDIRLKGSSLAFGPQALFLIPPQETHQFVNTGRGTLELYYIGFGNGLRALGGHDAESAQALRLPDAGEAFLGRLDRLAESIESARRGTGAYRDQALLFDTIYALVDLVEARPGLTRDFTMHRDGHFADKARRFLESNMHRTVSVEEVAAKFFLSPHYFARKFKLEAGCGIKEYHNRVRMLRAAELLQDPLLSVSEVARKLGFENANYFTNRFREFHGAPPSGRRRRAAADSRNSGDTVTHA